VPSSAVSDALSALSAMVMFACACSPVVARASSAFAVVEPLVALCCAAAAAADVALIWAASDAWRASIVASSAVCATPAVRGGRGRGEGASADCHLGTTTPAATAAAPASARSAFACASRSADATPTAALISAICAMTVTSRPK
jgi:hypothetical protein